MIVHFAQSRPGAADQLARSHFTASWVLAFVVASEMALVSVLSGRRNATAADGIVTPGMKHFAIINHCGRRVSRRLAFVALTYVQWCSDNHCLRTHPNESSL
jgi:hypothetical protein